MPNLRLLVPDATVNYITNPELRYATTGWTAAGSTISRTLDYARFGIASLKVVTGGTVLNEGAFFRVSSLQGVSEPVTVSIYARGEGKVRIRLIDNPFGQQFVGKTTKLSLDRWTRLTVSGRISGTAAGNDVRLYVETNEGTAKARTFYLDGAQMERKSYATTYCSGSQPGCKWNIVDSGSTSVRTADTRLGGRWVDVAGPCREDDDIYVTIIGGMGSAPIQNQIQSFALAPGSYYQGYKIKDRVVTLSFHVKKKSLTKRPPMTRLHELRQQLIDIIKPDKTIGSEPFMLEYSDDEGTRPLYAWFRYEAGLEGEWDVRNGWVNSFPMRLIAVDPFWYEDNQDVVQLGISETTAGAVNTNALWNKKDLKWSYLGLVGQGTGGSTQGGKDVIEAPDGSVYIAGSTGVIGASNQFVYKWDGATLSQFATANNIIWAMAIGQDGTLYASGEFTSIGGVAAARVAKCNLSTGVWSAMGAGLNDIGRALCVAKNGQVYAGGDFTTAGGVACLRIARWDGSQWRTVGSTSGFSGSVYCATQALDSNTLYVGGNFLASNGGGVTYNCIASIDTTTNLISQVGYGFADGFLPGPNLYVQALAVGLDGTLYAGGSFQSIASPGSGTVMAIAQYNGGSWSAVGGGLGSVVNTLAVNKLGELYAGGYFTLTGTFTPTGGGLFTTSEPITTLRGVAKYSNGAWQPIDIYFTPTSNSNFCSKIYFSKAGDIYITYGATVAYNVRRAYYNTVTNNGTAQLFPSMYIKGAGTLISIENLKTQKGVFFETDIGANEEVSIDFARGIYESTTRGSLLSTIVGGSEIRAVNLLPGSNEFSVLVSPDTGCIAQLRWVPRHWSVDAVMDAEAL